MQYFELQVANNNEETRVIALIVVRALTNYSNVFEGKLLHMRKH